MANQCADEDFPGVTHHCTLGWRWEHDHSFAFETFCHRTLKVSMDAIYTFRIGGVSGAGFLIHRTLLHRLGPRVPVRGRRNSNTDPTTRGAPTYHCSLPGEPLFMPACPAKTLFTPAVSRCSRRLARLNTVHTFYLPKAWPFARFRPLFYRHNRHTYHPIFSILTFVWRVALHFEF